MQIVSEAVKQLVDNYAPVTLAVYIDGEKLDVGIGSSSYTGACAGDDEFSFGNACAAGVNIDLAVPRPSLKGHRIQVTWSVNGTEYPLLTGQVEKSKVTAGHTAVEAWDDMYFSGSKVFTIIDEVAGDCDAAAAFSAVAASMGVTAETAALTLLAGLTIPGGLSNLGSEVSNSAVAGYIAGLVGGNALMTRAGLLTIRQYTDTGWETEPYSGGASAENEDFSVTGVTLQREETVSKLNSDGTTSEQTKTTEYSAGDGSLMMSNPLAGQDAADRAFSALQAVVVRPGTFTFPGGLLLDPGDIFTVKSMDGSYAVAVGSVTMSFDGGVKSSVACGGTTEDGGTMGAINQVLKTILVDLANFKKLYAGNANIVSAYIEHLETKKLRADTVELLSDGDNTYVFASKDELTAFCSSAASGMEVNTQKVFSVYLDFEPIWGNSGVLTVSLSVDTYGNKNAAASVITSMFHIVCWGSAIGSDDEYWGGWVYPNLEYDVLQSRVVQDYSDGVWHIRKWSNGQCELWKTCEATVPSMSAWGSMYIYPSAIQAQTYPVTFMNPPLVQATPQIVSSTVYGIYAGAPAGTTTASPGISVWRGGTASSFPVRVDLYVKGTLA